MWLILETHPKTVSQSGRAIVFTKPHRSQTIVGVPCRWQLLPARFSGDLHSGRRAHQQERLPPIYLLVEASSENNFTRVDLMSGAEIHKPARGGACDTVFTRASSSRCVCRRQANPSTPCAPPSPEKPFFFTFSLRPLLLRFLLPESPSFFVFSGALRHFQDLRSCFC